MVFKLPGIPTSQADTHELADFAELLCWMRGSTSEREIVAALGRIDDNDTMAGCNDVEDENGATLDEVMNEIERRDTACGSGYPFKLELEGTVLKCCPVTPEATQSIVYLYLLLSTRLNMKSDRIHADIDGADLLETLSAHALKSYLGTSNARSMVFGTSKSGTFPDRVNNLCQELREGTGFRSLDNAPVQAKDDKLDAVAWIPFADRLPSQLIIFAQCKTGTSWHDSTAQLQPGVFIDKWMGGKVLVNPLRAFCVSEAIDTSRFRGIAKSAGVLFDRCRLVQFSDGLSGTTLSKIQTWTKAALETDPLNGK